MHRVKVLITVLLAVLMVPLLSGCGSVSQDEQKQISAFYIGFVKQGTSLNGAAITQLYSKLLPDGKKVAGGDRAMFEKFNEANPVFFNTLELDGASAGDLSKTYSSALLLSLATNDVGMTDGVDVTFPLDAISAHDDSKWGKVYEIDRKKVTASFPDSLNQKIDRPAKDSLAPVRIVKTDAGWKVLADGNMLTEVGVPKPDQITSPISVNQPAG